MRLLNCLIYVILLTFSNQVIAQDIQLQKPRLSLKVSNKCYCEIRYLQFKSKEDLHPPSTQQLLIFACELEEGYLFPVVVDTFPHARDKELKLFDLDKDGKKEIVLILGEGAHYNSVHVYKFDYSTDPYKMKKVKGPAIGSDSGDIKFIDRKEHIEIATKSVASYITDKDGKYIELQQSYRLKTGSLIKVSEKKVPVSK